MSFPRTSAELVKNTSTVSPTTLATVKDALDTLNAASPASVLTTLGDLLSYNSGPVRVPVGAADTFLGSTGAALPSYRTAAQVLASLGLGLNAWSLSDDTATSFTLPNASAFVPVLVWGSGTNTGTANPWILWFFRGSGTPAVRTEFSGSGIANVVATTGPLTGTTGADGDFTLSAADDGKIYLENRSGSARSGRALFLWGA